MSTDTRLTTRQEITAAKRHLLIALHAFDEGKFQEAEKRLRWAEQHITWACSKMDNDDGALAQLAAQSAFTRSVGGSAPPRPTR